ncbi:MAG TPA: phenol 2-monooxygenase domain-containing protein [Acholeplasma sp.]|nr:phenol 2-monooxygenase domain-containing protein [Acholeplasma sp.]
MDYIWTPIILISVLIAVTLLVILLDKLLGGGGERKITVNKNNVVTISGDDTALNALTNNKIFLPSSCGGKATCGTCKFRLVDWHEPPKSTELSFLSKEEVEEGVRLACQVKVTQDIEIQVPESILNVKPFWGKVVEVEQLTHDIKRVKFEMDEDFPFKPGQYLQITVPGIETTRAYSIASDSKDLRHPEVIIRLVPGGVATKFVHKALIVGDKIKITGPFGDFFLKEDSKRPIIMIAGGSGKAPIRSIIYKLMDQGMPRKATYFFGARTKKDLYYTDYFLDVAKKYPNFKYVPALSTPLPEDEWTLDEGLITDVVRRHTEDLSGHEAYLCGSPGMIDACIKVLKEKGMPEEYIYFDKF